MIYQITSKKLRAISLPTDGSSSPAEKWVYDVGHNTYSAPSIGENGAVIYFGSHGKKLHAVNAADGSLRWEYQADGIVRSGSVIDANGVVYFGDYTGNLYGVSAEGDLVLKFATGGRIYATPAIWFG